MSLLVDVVSAKSGLDAFDLLGNALLPKKPIMTLQQKADVVKNKFEGKRVGYLVIDEVKNGELIFKDASTYQKLEKLGSYMGKDKYKNNRFKVNLLDAEKAEKFYQALQGQIKLDKFDPPVDDSKVIVKNTEEISYERKALRELGADLVNPDAHGGYMGSYYSIDKKSFLDDLKNRVENKKTYMYESVLNNVVGVDINRFVEQVKADIELKKEQENQKKEHDKKQSENSQINEFSKKIDSLIKSHGKDAVMERLIDAYLGNKSRAEKVFSGENPPNKDAVYELDLLSDTRQ